MCIAQILALPRSVAIRRQIQRLAASYNRTRWNGRLPVSGLITLTGKAERLPRGHLFRRKVAEVLRDRRRTYEQACKGFASLTAAEKMACDSI